MKISGLMCWHCGASLDNLPQPIGRREECPSCASSLHVCRLCDFYDRGSSKDCREPMAEEITDKEAANFCDYYRPKPGLTGASDKAAAEARAKLDALFGGGTKPKAPLQAPSAETSKEALEARRKLESIFGEGKR